MNRIERTLPRTMERKSLEDPQRNSAVTGPRRRINAANSPIAHNVSLQPPIPTSGFEF